MTEDRLARDRECIVDASQRGTVARLRAYTRLSGPGWLQGAITLGGGSLAGSLYLGILTGFSLLWLQVFAMLMGVTMLAAIAWVTLSTGKRPFQAINDHINPVLGWGWAIATLLANMVWCLPQFNLGVAAVQQNLLPAMEGTAGKVGTCAVLLATATTVIWFYDTGARGIRIFEILLKIIVAIIVISFFGVIVTMTFKGGLDWGSILSGYVPDLSLLWSPAATFDPHIEAVAPQYQSFWVERILADQRDVMVTAVATAVGINMTFLLPYSMLAKGWTREFRGLAVFDLSTGLLIPFVLATSCVVIASASAFHAQPDESLIEGREGVPAKIVGQYEKLLDARIEVEHGAGALTEEEGIGLRAAASAADKKMASMLVRRDSFHLADSLSPLLGSGFSQTIFGIGVLGMALSTIIILMLISGFVVCEMLGVEARGRTRRLACLLPAVGVLGPFVWSGDAKFWLAVPTSVFGAVLLPIAYLTFVFMMNHRGLLGAAMPRGPRRLGLNMLMLLALTLAGVGAGWVIWSKAHWYGVGAVLVFVSLAVVVHFVRPPRPVPSRDTDPVSES